MSFKTETETNMETKRERGEERERGVGVEGEWMRNMCNNGVISHVFNSTQNNHLH